MRSWTEGIAREIPTYLSEELLGWIEEAWAALVEGPGGEQLGSEALDSLETRLRRFESCRAESQVQLLDGWRAFTDPPIVLCVLIRSYDYWEQGIGKIPLKTRGFDDRFAALFELPKSVGGPAIIRPETLGDKVAELFSRKEVDFDSSPSFSRRYYLPATDEAMVREALSPEMLDCFATRSDLSAELLGKDMLLLWPGSPARRSLLEAVPFLAELGRRIGPSSSGPYR